MNAPTATSPVDFAPHIDPTRSGHGSEHHAATDDHGLLQIAHRIDDHGPASAECDIALVVGYAERAGLAGTALAVLSDTSQPDVARARAFGVIATRLWRASAASQSRHDRQCGRTVQISDSTEPAPTLRLAATT